MLRFLLIIISALLLTPLATSPALARTGSSAAQVHVVKQGDTLYDIARLHGMSVAELKRLNGLRGNRLKLGQKLALNRAAAPPATQSVAKKAAPAAAKASAGKDIHVVRKGDTLFTIARRHRLTVDELKQLNSLSSSRLKIGQRLALSGTADAEPAAAPRSRESSGDVHVVRKGDTLQAVARRNGTTVNELKRLNGLRSTRLKIGQRLALSDPEDVPSPLLLPGDSSEDEVLEMAYAAGSELEQVAFRFLSTPYRFGGNSRKGIDCSAFVQQVFREVDIDLPRSAREQFRVGEQVDRGDLQAGDLLFFRTYAKFPSHVGIYLGDGKMIHASSRSHRVVVTSIDYPYYRKRFIGAKRISLLDDQDEAKAPEASGEAAPAADLPAPDEPATAPPTSERPAASTEAVPATITAAIDH